MATFEQTITNLLVDNGLGEDEAQQVMAKVKADDKVMGDRWGDHTEGYPRPMLTVLWDTARHRAVQWIDENKPTHWARAMFVDEPPKPDAEPTGP